MDLPDLRDYHRLRQGFGWHLPARYNIGVDVCDRWAALEPDRPAIIDVVRGQISPVSYGALRDRSNRLANLLRRLGIGTGDRVAILLPQGSDVVVAHVATYKIGAIALPLAPVFGPDGLFYRLDNAGAAACVTDAAGVQKIAPLRASLPALHAILSTDGADGSAIGLPAAMERESSFFDPVPTGPDDPALMIYTSGTTGQPKGALHGHRVLLGHLPGVRFSHEFLPQRDDVMWTPADWAWAGGLLNALLPSLHYGVPVVARAFDKFDPDEAWRLMADLKVRNAFIPPTALRMLGLAMPPPSSRPTLRTVTSAGEALGAEIVAWGLEAFGLSINDVYGQTECNYVLASCAAIGIDKRGAIGRAVPGHDVAVIRDDGSVCEPGEVGEIAVRSPDPAMFLRYWNKPTATAAKFRGSWMITGDRASADHQGYVTFQGRDDDIITSSGYRIGPAEIETCLRQHPAVAEAAAVGKPDPLRTEIVKAFIVLRPGIEASSSLEADIRDLVRHRLSAHEYPREIAFVLALPMTPTGKVMRRVLRERG
ncbi:AMP-binding protein [Lichenihabitans psoromatis]|uniref:AMP-binding protein n=1 Tax=Lichenihabitans psoromatis TaxID=2528642 RepID=UPI0010384720|nr:AMP-binding protein [Lichenihabitans psoromatis]